MIAIAKYVFNLPFMKFSIAMAGKSVLTSIKNPTTDIVIKTNPVITLIGLKLNLHCIVK